MIDPLTREIYWKMQRYEYTVRPRDISYRSGEGREHTSAVCGFHWGPGVFINDNNDYCSVSVVMDEDGELTYAYNEKSLVTHYGPPEPYFQGPKVPPMQGPEEDPFRIDDPCQSFNRSSWDRDHPSCPNWNDLAYHWDEFIVDDFFNCNEFDLEIQCAPPERWNARRHGRGETRVIS